VILLDLMVIEWKLNTMWGPRTIAKVASITRLYDTYNYS